jgi:hypothetical protein
VHGLQLVSGGRAGLDLDDGVVQPGHDQAVHDRAEAGGTLGVAGTGVVVAKARVGGEEDGSHDP